MTDFAVLVFARGAFASRHEFPDLQLARTFKHGFTRAAGMLAGGANARAWCLPEDKDAMEAIEPPDAIEAAYVFVTRGER